MNRELIAEFPKKSYGLIHEVYRFMYGVVLRDRPELSDVCNELVDVPGVFYVEWLRGRDFDELCEAHGVSGRLKQLLIDCRYYYQLTPESVADFMKYCRQTVQDKENINKKRATKVKVKYDLLFDVPLYKAHVEEQIIPMFERVEGPISNAMKKYVSAERTIGRFRELVDWIVARAFVNKVGEDITEADDIEPIYDVDDE